MMSDCKPPRQRSHPINVTAGASKVHLHVAANGPVGTRLIIPKNGRALRRHPRGVEASNLRRRQFLRFAAGAAALPAVSRDASAQSYPLRPITMIVPIAAGSSSDTVGRLVAERMGRALGQSIIVENVSGADGTIGVGRAARARADGYTIEFGSQTSNVLNGAFYSLSYDLLGDLTPISPMAAVSMVLYAKASLPAKDLKELIAWLRANPNKASAGVIAVGYRMMMALFQKETRTRFTLVPYRGIPPELQDLVAGRIDFFFDTPSQLQNAPHRFNSRSCAQETSRLTP
jgi:tripartite-type tricarboxylate transporter receptor subunit TctC